MRLKKKQDLIRIYNRIVKTVCGECFVGCGLKFLQDNQVVDMAGDEDHPINKGSICPRGAKIMEKLSGHGNSLLQYPMKKRVLMMHTSVSAGKKELIMLLAGWQK